MPQLNTLVTLLLRHLIGGLGAYFGLTADLDEQTMQAVVGAIMALLAVGWSAYEKRIPKTPDLPLEVQPKVFTQEHAEQREDRWMN